MSCWPLVMVGSWGLVTEGGEEAASGMWAIFIGASPFYVSMGFVDDDDVSPYHLPEHTPVCLPTDILAHGTNASCGQHLCFLPTEYSQILEWTIGR